MKIELHNINFDKKIKTIFVSFILITFSLIASGILVMHNEFYEATIKHTKNGEIHKFVGVFINKTKNPIEARYTFDAIKEGVSGRSVSSQSGGFIAKENQQ